MKPTLFHRACLLILFLLIFTAGLLPAVMAQTNGSASASAQLPPDAQDALKKGVIAAQQQKWLIAIQSFQDARKSAPDAPVLFYNLGLAESKIAGRELRAICWLSAYLTASPNSPSAGAVKELITELEIKSEGNNSRLLKTALDIANQIPVAYEETILGTKYEAQRSGALASVAKLYAYSGDGNKATEIAVESHLDLNTMANAGVISWMVTYGGEGGISGARKLWSIEVSKYYKDAFAPLVYGTIAEQEASLGDIASAWRDFNSMPDNADADTTQHKVDVLIAIAKAQFLAGNKQDSSKTLLLAKNLIDKSSSPTGNDWMYEALAQAQMESGDSTNARITAGLIQKGDLKSSALRNRGQYVIKPERVGVDVWTKYVSYDLDAAVFLDPAAYLQSLPSANPQKYLEAIIDTSQRVLEAQMNVDRMLKQQAAR